MPAVPKNARELRRLAESDVPVLAFAFSRRKVEDWAPPHRHARGQLVALTAGLLVVEAENARWMFPSQRCAWIPPDCLHAARSVGGASGAMLYLSPEVCRGLPKQPCLFGSSELLFAIVRRSLTWDPCFPLRAAEKRLIEVLRDEIRKPGQPLHLPMPRDPRLAKVAHALMENVADQRTLDEWGRLAGMSRRNLMRAFSGQVGITFGRWRQQARLFAGLEMLAAGKSVTETAMGVGYDSVSAFIEVFRTMLGSTPRVFLRNSRDARPL